MAELYLRLEHELDCIREALHTELGYRYRFRAQAFLIYSITPEELIPEEGHYCCWAL